jgi:hypothetical protein
MSAAVYILYVTVAGAVCAAMLLATWRSHRARQRLGETSSSLVAELTWAMIPWLLMLAAVAPTALESIHRLRAAAASSVAGPNVQVVGLQSAARARAAQ